MTLSEVAVMVMPLVMQVREHLHMNPFPRWEEGPALHYIKSQIMEILSGLDSHQGVPIFDIKDEFTGGLVVDVDVDPSYRRRILLRADVDALPVTEATGLPFTSQRPGFMHACGHDVHSAMLLGAFRAVMTGLVKPAHNLRFVWQRAEENPGASPQPVSGGDMLVREKVLDDITAVYGLHIWNSPEHGKPGVFLSRPGPFMANSGRMRFLIKSSGGHVMNPRGGVNAMRVAYSINTALQQLFNRELLGTQNISFEPTGLRAGRGLESSNIMPKEAELSYALRTLVPRGEHEQMMQMFADNAKAVAQTMGAELVEAQLVGGHPVLTNTPECYQRMVNMLTAAGHAVEEHPQILGGEDFAHYLSSKPGCFWMLGAYTPGSGDHHSPTFNPDPSVFPLGVEFWLRIITSTEL